MIPLLLVLSAIFPVAVFMFIIFRSDTKREPLKLLILCFVMGCVSVIPILIVELMLGLVTFSSPFLSSFYNAFIIAALTEETFKFLVLYLFVWRSKEFDQYFDGIVYAVIISLGFACVENILYVLQSGFTVALMRAILSVPGHGFFGVIMGYFFSLARFNPQKKNQYLLLSLFMPILFHGLYDFFLFYMGSVNNAIVAVLMLVAVIALVVVMWIYGIRNIRKHYKTDVYIDQESQAGQPADSLYMIQPGYYDRMILMKGVPLDFILQKITEFGRQSFPIRAQQHSFQVGQFGDWQIIRVGDSVSFYNYHQLVGWLSGSGQTMGFAKHKMDPTCDFVFFLDPNRPYRDSEIGVFRNGATFFVYLPQANEVSGNITISSAVRLAWNDIVGGLYNDGIDISRYDQIGYANYMIQLNS